MSKLAAAWEWVKKNWHWIVVPVGVVLYLMGRAGRRNVHVVSPQLVQHEEVEREAEQKATSEQQAAAKTHDEKVQQVDQVYENLVKNIKAADARRAEALKDDPVALNRFLKEVDKTTKS